jgi:peroxiredoxin
MRKTLKTLPLLCATALLATSSFVLAQDKKDEKPKDEPKKEKVAAAELGKAAPAFALKNLDGKEVKLADYKGKIVVLEWFQPTCPTCDKVYSEGGACLKTSDKLMKDGVVWLLVNSDGADPDSKIEVNKDFLKAHKIAHTVLLDPEGKTGRAYGAKTSPHCMVIDAKGNLAYRGAIDNAQEKDAKEKLNYVEAAVSELKAGKPVRRAETRSYG